MCASLVRCLLFFTHLGDKGPVTLKDHYKGNECNIRLDPNDYYEGISVLRLSSLNGNPHYLIGYDLKGARLLYCAKVTSKKKLAERVNYELSVPEKVLKGKIAGIQVIALKTSDKGGNVRVEEGGVDASSVVLSLQSGLEKSFDYVVSILGTPNSHRRL